MGRSRVFTKSSDIWPITAAALIFALISYLIASVAYAQSRIGDLHVSKPPRFLYHWIDATSLSQEWRLTALQDTGKMPLPKMKDSFLLVDALPSLGGKRGLFSWTHPVTGMGTGREEMTETPFSR